MSACAGPWPRPPGRAPCPPRGRSRARWGEVACGLLFRITGKDACGTFPAPPGAEAAVANPWSKPRAVRPRVWRGFIVPPLRGAGRESPSGSESDPDYPENLSKLRHPGNIAVGSGLARFFPNCFKANAGANPRREGLDDDET